MKHKNLIQTVMIIGLNLSISLFFSACQAPNTNQTIPSDPNSVEKTDVEQPAQFPKFTGDSVVVEYTFRFARVII